MTVNFDKVRLAEVHHLADIMILMKNCAATLQEKKIMQWGEDYPSSEGILKDIKNRELYFIESEGLEEEKKPIAVITLNEFQDTEYATIDWLNESKENVLVVHRLAVEPRFWGQGWGGFLMDFAEDLGRKKGYQSIRFDVFSGNVASLRFYEKKGYQRLGTINLSSCGVIEAFCYEKMLNTRSYS